jgi:hypothetical protein
MSVTQSVALDDVTLSCRVSLPAMALWFSARMVFPTTHEPFGTK